MDKQITFTSLKQVEVYREKIIRNIDKTNSSLKELSESSKGLEFLRKIKFEKSSFDTLFNDPVNYIEQINQTCTYLVCLAAVRIMLIEFPQHSFIVNFGVAPGHDVVSEDGTIICECFAVTAPDRNEKLKKDVKKMYNNITSKYKYVIFYASTSKHGYVQNIRSKYPSLEIIPLDDI